MIDDDVLLLLVLLLLVRLLLFVSSIVQALQEAALLVEEWIIGVAHDRVGGIECHPVIVIERRTQLKPPR